ncbi:hypothetical protein BJX63DRAFT_430924 [Aspergillus granulosus]|uniref:Uncharacterized protein n=1 Tax=Aspergillus granulosus TaxID=176169 RepID=A0ABR4HI63_9EURO
MDIVREAFGAIPGSRFLYAEDLPKDHYLHDRSKVFAGIPGNVALATRVYEKLRFDRVRKCQRNGDDMRDRWHSALKRLDAGESLNPEDVMMMNRWLYPDDAEADTFQRWKETATVVERELEQGKIIPLFSIGQGVEV